MFLVVFDGSENVLDELIVLKWQNQ